MSHNSHPAQAIKDSCLSVHIRPRGLLSFARTNVQQLTCNIDLSCNGSFYYLFFTFVLLELKPLVLKGESPGGKSLKKCENV